MAVVREGILVYGATGHTGMQVAQWAKEVGLRVTLAGRNLEKLRLVAERTAQPFEAFPLSDTRALDESLSRHLGVLHLAGPFEDTAHSMAQACLRTRTHYADVTGERTVVANLAELDSEAQARGVMIMPAVGYDCIPGDCLAAHLVQRLPSATDLDLGVFFSLPGPSGQSSKASHGTMLSGLRIIAQGGLVRRNGSLQPDTLGHHLRRFPCGDWGPPVTGVSFPTAELVVAGRSTRVSNITCFVPGSSGSQAFLWLLQGLSPLLRLPPLRALISGILKRQPSAADAPAPEDERMCVLGEARDAATGARVQGAVRVSSGYLFTARSAVEVGRRMVAADVKPGFQTPSSAYGADFVLQIPDAKAERIDIVT